MFSYKDIQNYGVHPVNMIRVKQLARERVESNEIKTAEEIDFIN